MAEHWTDAERESLLTFVTNLDQPVYCLKNLPEEVVSVLFAYVSRSPNSFRRNLIQLLGSGDLNLNSACDVYAANDFTEAKAKAEAFHNKWVVGYGHSSVAEHTDIKYAIDRLSILATKVVEDARLGRFTEKSTRYQIMDINSFYTPPELADTPYGSEYQTLHEELFTFYSQAIEKLQVYIREIMPVAPEQSPTAYGNAVKAKACDIARYILPTSTLTMMALSVNAREAEHLIVKMRSHPLAEARTIGESLLQEGRMISPTLLKYCEPSVWQATRWQDMSSRAVAAESSLKNGVRLLEFDARAEDKILAAYLYPQRGEAYESLWTEISAGSDDQKDAVWEKIWAGRTAHDGWPRAWEVAEYLFECTMDYGAYRDLQRHRLLSPYVPLLTPHLGYETPAEIGLVGLEEEYRGLMDKAAALSKKIALINPQVAQYCLPLAMRIRFVWHVNLRSLAHIIRLRSGVQGHYSYRHIAQDLYRAVAAVQPRLARHLEVNLEESYLGRLASEEKIQKNKPH